MNKLLTQINNGEWGYSDHESLPAGCVYYYETWKENTIYIEVTDTKNNWERINYLIKDGNIKKSDIYKLINKAGCR